MPKVDLDKTEGRIKAETVTEYLELFYKKVSSPSRLHRRRSSKLRLPVELSILTLVVLSSPSCSLLRVDYLFGESRCSNRELVASSSNQLSRLADRSSFGKKVVFLDRPEGQNRGWIVRTQDVTTEEVTEETWERVILAQGVRRFLSLSSPSDSGCSG